MSKYPAGYSTGIGESYVSEARGSSSPPRQRRPVRGAVGPRRRSRSGSEPRRLVGRGDAARALAQPRRGRRFRAALQRLRPLLRRLRVMCYPDDPAAPAMTYPCPRIPGVMSQVYDCGGDDYFNVAPAAGTYLADHWNLYDNRFLAACADAAPACGGTTALQTNPQPPVSTTQPAITGEARVGSVLTALAGGSTTRRPPSSSSGSRATARPGWPSPARPAQRTPSPRRTSTCACACASSPSTRTAPARILPAHRHRDRPARGARHDALLRTCRGAPPRARAAADHARAGSRRGRPSGRSPSRSPTAACEPPRPACGCCAAATSCASAPRPAGRAARAAR